mmetsp:Transcript_68445/g.182580  ORF Transcript_68445/g.182580 Transcript_68445/m.182580 type:complete len:242 (+) Transcript_68445:533-1258(+)
MPRSRGPDAVAEGVRVRAHERRSRAGFPLRPRRRGRLPLRHLGDSIFDRGVPLQSLSPPSSFPSLPSFGRKVSSLAAQRNRQAATLIRPIAPDDPVRLALRARRRPNARRSLEEAQRGQVLPCATPLPALLQQPFGGGAGGGLRWSPMRGWLTRPPPRRWPPFPSRRALANRCPAAAAAFRRGARDAARWIGGTARLGVGWKELRRKRGRWWRSCVAAPAAWLRLVGMEARVLWRGLEGVR